MLSEHMVAVFQVTIKSLDDVPRFVEGLVASDLAEPNE
jgi:hypothetical protein